jgi:PPOX class probable F420-dependent enzyme
MPKRRSQIELTPEEQAAMLQEARTVQIASNGHDGYPHVVAMWYAVVDGAICFSTYGTSQKVLNLRRDPHVTALVEMGTRYDELRGLAIKGKAELIEAGAPERERLQQELGTEMGQRYGGGGASRGRGLSPKRVIVRIVPEKTYSWDHRKLPTGVY